MRGESMRKALLAVFFLFIVLCSAFSATNPSTRFQIQWMVRNVTQMEAQVGLYTFGTNSNLSNSVIDLVSTYGEQGVCTMYYTTNYIGSSAEHPIVHHFSFTAGPLVNSTDSNDKLPITVFVKRDSSVVATLKTFTMDANNQIIPVQSAQSTVDVSFVKPANQNINRLTVLFDFYVDLSDALGSMTAGKIYSSSVSVEVTAP